MQDLYVRIGHRAAVRRQELQNYSETASWRGNRAIRLIHRKRGGAGVLGGRLTGGGAQRERRSSGKSQYRVDELRGRRVLKTIAVNSSFHRERAEAVRGAEDDGSQDSAQHQFIWRWLKYREKMDVIKREEAKRVASGGGTLGRRATSWDCGFCTK